MLIFWDSEHMKGKTELNFTFLLLSQGNPAWSGTHCNPPASASCMLGLQAWITAQLLKRIKSSSKDTLTAGSPPAQVLMWRASPPNKTVYRCVLLYVLGSTTQETWNMARKFRTATKNFFYPYWNHQEQNKIGWLVDPCGTVWGPRN